MHMSTDREYGYSARRLHLRLVFLLAAFAAPSAASTANTIQIIANTDAPVSELSVTTLRSIFSMRARNWPADGPVRVFVLPDRDDRHAVFAKQVLRIYPYVLRVNWDRLVFTGTGAAPIEVRDQDELVRRVASTPGAIGYILNGQLVNENIKVLAIR
jgi:ABC-type phosphate transport system substrate-binding protein